MDISIHKNFIFHLLKITLLDIFIFSSICISAQPGKIDSLKNELALATEDTMKIVICEELGQAYRNERKTDSSVFCYKQALEINERINYSLQKQCLDIAAIQFILYEMGNYAESLKYASRQLELTGRIKDTFQMGFAHATFGHNYKALGEYRLALNHYFNARQIFFRFFHFTDGTEEDPYINQCIGEVYLRMNKLDSAFIYSNKSLQQTGTDPANRLYSTRILGDIYFARRNYDKALNLYREYVVLFTGYNKPPFTKYKHNRRDLSFVFNSMAKIFQMMGQRDSAFFFSNEALVNALQYQDQENTYDAARLLYNFFKDSSEHEAFKYFKIAADAKDSMVSLEKQKQIQILSYNEQLREKEQAVTDAKEAAKDRLIIIITTIVVAITSFLIWYRIKQLRLKYKTILEQKEAEKLKVKYDKQLVELEAKALRAQMNPHFIFNCMNSIKALVQQKEEDKAVNYLTTFSKLIRTIFQNSDKREITLFDELETCKLYTQLESMRFGNKFRYQFSINEDIDLKSLMVPALIIQPFIENAIWHGIMPKEEGGTLTVSITKNGDAVYCIIEDDGIGRDMSKQNKFKAEQSTHQSKGVHLTQSRLDLNNALNQRNAAFEIIDKKDAAGNATGTKVVLAFVEF